MEFNELIEKRRSVRAFDAGKKVTRKQVEEIIQATLMAPTWKNYETGRYYVVLSGEILETFRSEFLPEFNQKSSAGAALVITTFVKDISGFTKGEPDNELGNMWGAYDLGLQNAYFCLKAADMGLDTLIMGIRNGADIRVALNIPENEEIVSVIALGYRQGEPVFRPRKEVGDVAKIY